MGVPHPFPCADQHALRTTSHTLYVGIWSTVSLSTTLTRIPDSLLSLRHTSRGKDSPLTLMAEEGQVFQARTMGVWGEDTSSKGLCLYSDVITLMALVLVPDGHVNSHWAASHKSRDHFFTCEALTSCLADRPAWING